MNNREDEKYKNRVTLATKSILKKPTTLFGLWRESEDQREARNDLAEFAKDQAIELSKVQTDETVKTNKLKTEIIVQAANSQAVIDHHTAIQKLRIANDEQAAKSIVKVLESKAASVESIEKLDSPLKQRAIQASNAIHLAAAQRIINRSND